MNLKEIVEEIGRLSPEERQELIRRVSFMDDAQPSPEEQATLDELWQEFWSQPQSSQN